MPTIAHHLRENEGIKRLTAPRGKIYEITDIHVAILAANANTVVIVDRAVEEERTFLNPEDDQHVLVFPASIANAFDATFGVPIRTKYVSIGPGNVNNAIQASVVLNFNLVTASRAELIWEWFSKKR